MVWFNFDVLGVWANGCGHRERDGYCHKKSWPGLQGDDYDDRYDDDQDDGYCHKKSGDGDIHQTFLAVFCECFLLFFSYMMELDADKRISGYWSLLLIYSSGW